MRQLIRRLFASRARPAPPVPARPQVQLANLRARFLDHYDLQDRRGLEIGPFCKPVFRRDAFPGILYADVMGEEFLKRLARKSRIRDEADVVPLDYVLGEKHLDGVIDHGTLDFVFCAHVLEHTPDMIATLKGIDRVLRPGGLFVCFFPDRRYTYDAARPATTLAQLRDRHSRRITRPDPDVVLEHYTHSRKADPAKLWQGADAAALPRRFTAQKAQEFAERAKSSYVDVHCNILSDGEFQTVIETLAAEGDIALRLDRLAPTRAPFHEFHVALRKHEPRTEQTARTSE